jgi:hypothetical protein
MAGNKKIETILVELDCLLDTRLGTIERMGVEHAARVLTPAYLARQQDVFDGVDRDEFRRLYQARDVETLKHSKLTNLATRLRDLTTALSEMAIARPYFDGVKIAVNTYPYQLDAETSEAVGKAVAVWAGGVVPVELVSIRPEQLTPALVKTSFAMLFMYEYERWMDMHAEAFKDTRLNEVHLIAPALYFNEQPDEKVLKGLVRDAAHPFVAMTMLASPLVGLELIDVKYFSIVEPPQDTPA